METVFSERLKQARASTKMTQAQLGGMCKLSSTSIAAYENGQKVPRITTAAKLASVLNVSLDWLMGLDDKQSQHPRTLGDCARLLVDMVTFIVGEYWLLSIDNYMENGAFVSFRNETIHVFMDDWMKVHRMYAEKVIDQEMYEAWMEKRFRELDAIPLPDSNK